MPLRDQLTILLQSCRSRVESGRRLWREGQDSIRAANKAVLASRALIERSDRTIERLRVLMEDAPEESRDAGSAPKEDFLEAISGRTFREEIVALDGRHFIRCSLYKCTLQYSGQPVVIESTEFCSCRFRFSAEAALTVQLLECFDLMLPDSRDIYIAVASKTSRQQLPN